MNNVRLVTKILLNRSNKFIPSLSTQDNNVLLQPNSVICALLKNLESLGFTLSPLLIESFRSMSMEYLKFNYEMLVSLLRESIGANVKYKPMYPNFPSQVMEADEAELYINAIIHYISNSFGENYIPVYDENERLPLFNSKALKVIDIGKPADLALLISKLISAKTNISLQDKEDIKTYLVETGNFEVIPEHITNKEILAFVIGVVISNNLFKDKWEYSAYIKTATDVLRVVVALSNGDVSLAENTKFINFKRSTRKLILYLFESCDKLEEDMLKYKNVYIRLGEKLHPGEYKKNFPKTFNAFNKIRNNIKIETFNSKIEQFITNKNIREAVDLLKTRPGEFARRLNVLFSICSKNVDDDYIIDNFEQVADVCSTAVLIQVLNYFTTRDTKEDRNFFIKGNLAKMKTISNSLLELDEYCTMNIRLICTNVLIERFSKLPKLGKVYLSEKMRNYIVPFSQRSASKAFKTIVRGSKIDIDDVAKFIRFFLYWKNGSERVDVDLSAVILDKDWKQISVLSYYSLRASNLGCHSGDFVSAAEGASEFIDINLEKVKEMGGRYIVMTVNSFSHHTFAEMEKCFAGFMSREDADSGEVYEPASVENKYDLTNNGTFSIPLVIDVVERKVIWCDMSGTSVGCINNVRGNKLGIISTCKALSNLKKMNLSTLFALHVAGRGEIVEKREDADFVIDEKDADLTPFDIEKIMADWM